MDKEYFRTLEQTRIEEKSLFHGLTCHRKSPNSPIGLDWSGVMGHGFGRIPGLLLTVQSISHGFVDIPEMERWRSSDWATAECVKAL